MTTLLNRKNLIVFGILAAGLMLLPAVFAQTGASDIPANLTGLAQELGCKTKTDCATAFDANFEKGLGLAEKYNIYDTAQKQIAQTFRQEVLAKLSGAENIEEKIVEIAQNLIKNKPSLAKRLSVNSQDVKAAEIIVKEFKSAGVSLDLCGRPANSLTREQLKSCLGATDRLSDKADAIDIYISKERIVQAESNSKVVSLEEAMARGEYRDLGATAEDIGFKCLKPGSESITACDNIARRFFGAEGVTELARARSEVKNTEDYYLRGAQSFTLVTPDGQTLAGKEAITHACDQAFNNRNLGLARACGNFAVKNGFASQEGVEEGLRFFEGFTTQDNANVNFEDCRRNPKACEAFVPAEFKNQFQVGQQVFEIINATGISSSECAGAEFNPEVGRKCLESSRQALPKLKELASRSPEVAKVVEEIERRIKEGEAATNKINRIESFSTGAGGPGGCRNPGECYAYCKDPGRGPECIAFGAKNNVFQGDEAVARYQKYNQVIITGPTFFVGGETPGAFPGQGAYPGFQPPSTGQVPPGQSPGFTQPGPGFTSPTGYGYGGPSPECFEAIRNGDFAKAKEICNATPPSQGPYPGSYPTPYPGRPIACPTVALSSCPEGQYHETRFTGGESCPSYSECVAIPGYRPPIQVCPSLPTVNSCPTSEERYVSYNSPECGTYYGCRRVGESQCPSGQYWYVPPGGAGYCRQSESQSCPSGQYWSVPPGGGPGYCQSSQTQTCPSSQYWYIPPTGGPGYCKPSETQTCPSGQYWNGSSCVSNSTTYPPSGQKEQSWNSLGLKSWIRTDADQARIETLKQACASVLSNSNIWTPNAGTFSSPDFGMPDPEKCRQASSCSSGQYWNGTSCVTSGYQGGTCPPYQAWYVPPGGGAGYCQPIPGSNTSSTSGTCSNELISLLGSGCHNMSNAWFNGAMTQYVYPGTTQVKECSTTYISGCTGGGSTSCPSGQYWYVSPSGGSGYCTSTGTSCPSGQYWNGTACVSNTSTTPSGTCSSELVSLLGSSCHNMGNAWFNGEMSRYVYPGTTQVKECSTTYISGCTGGGSTSCPSGQYWYTPPSGGSGYCTSTGTSCPSGQYWNGTACVNTTPSDCPSGQYWYTPPGGGTGYCSGSGTTTSGSCTQELINLLGSSCHNMGNAWFNGEMSRYVYPGTTQVKECSTTYISGCTGGGSTSCPSGQYWYTPPSGGSGYCQSSQTQTCPTGQYWSGTACVNSTSGGSSSCYGGQVWDGTACNCPSGQTWSGSVCNSSASTSCPSGQYWSGSSCVTTSATDCPSGQYWSGSSCVPSGGTPTGGTTDPAAGCTTAGGTWTGSTCNMPSACPTGQYWNGSACVTSSGGIDPSYMIAQISSLLRELSAILRSLTGR